MSVRLPSFKPRELIALLERAGFVKTHQKGSHLYFRHAHTRRTTCVPVHSGDVPRGLVRKILFIDCGLTDRQVQGLLR